MPSLTAQFSNRDYGLVSPVLFGHLQAEYDTKKEYCPKYTVTWYLEKPASSQIITTFAPLLATAGLACMNVFNAGGAGPDLENSIALFLTIVFVLPNLRVEGRLVSSLVPAQVPKCLSAHVTGHVSDQVPPVSECAKQIYALFVHSGRTY